MEHAHIIEALGGYRALAEHFGRHKTKAWRWQSVGIPVRLWPDIVRLAEAAGRTDITLQTLAACAPQKRVQEDRKHRIENAAGTLPVVAAA